MRSMIGFLNYLSLSLFFSGVSAMPVGALTIDEFVRQVGERNGIVKTQKIDEESFRLRMSEATLLTSVNLFGSAQLTTDRKESQNPAFDGTKRTSSLYQVGFEQQSLLGVNHKIYYSLDRNELVGADPTFLQNPNVSKSSFNYEFNLPLWRNGFGRSTRDQVNVIFEQNKSDSLTSRFARKQIKANAIATYWRLKASQDLSKLLNEQLESNLTFLRWTKQRVQDRLSETTDLKQAEAAVALRRYEIEAANAELLESSQAFNEMLQMPMETAIPVLESSPDFGKLLEPERIANALAREDLQSLEALLNSQNAQSRISAENSRALIDLNALLSTNGLDARTEESFTKSTATNHPSYSVGLKLSIPLDRSSVSDVQRAAKLKSLSLENQIERKRYEVLAEFEKLKRNYAQVRKILELAKAVERAQFAKYETELQRRKIGRTSTFQLLSFQQEYQQSKQSVIRAQSAVLQLNAQFILFNQGPEDYL